MDKVITISFRWTAEEMLLAQRLHMRHSKQGRMLRRVLKGGAVFCCLLGVAALSMQQYFVMSSFPFFVLAALFASVPLLNRRAILNMHSQMPDRDMLVTCEVSKDRFSARSEVSSTEILWRAIPRASKVPEGFLLYPSARMFYWLPVRGFHEAADVERLDHFLKSNVRHYEANLG